MFSEFKSEISVHVHIRLHCYSIRHLLYFDILQVQPLFEILSFFGQARKPTFIKKKTILLLKTCPGFVCSLALPYLLCRHRHNFGTKFMRTLLFMANSWIRPIGHSLLWPVLNGWSRLVYWFLNSLGMCFEAAFHLWGSGEQFLIRHYTG